MPSFDSIIYYRQKVKCLVHLLYLLILIISIMIGLSRKGAMKEKKKRNKVSVKSVLVFIINIAKVNLLLVLNIEVLL